MEKKLPQFFWSTRDGTITFRSRSPYAFCLIILRVMLVFRKALVRSSLGFERMISIDATPQTQLVGH